MTVNASAITMGADLLEFGQAGFGWLPYSEIVPNNTTGLVVKAQPGLLGTIFISSIAAAALGYLRIYNQTTAPATTDTPVLRFMVPAAATGGIALVDITGGWYFDTGIAFRFTAALADNDATSPAASTYLLSLGYK